MTSSRLRAILAVLLLAVAAAAASDMRAEMAVRDSLRAVYPKLRARWLATRGLNPTDFIHAYRPDSAQGLSLKGKWGHGRSVEVTGKDSLTFLTFGSEVAVLDCADPESPSVLSEIQLGFMPYQTCLVDSLLVTGGGAVEMWSIANPAQPAFLGRILASVTDLCARDTFVYFVAGDSFRVYSIAVPSQPYQLGAYPDSGWATAVTGNTVALVLRNGIGFVDVSDPSHPQRVGLYGGSSVAATVRGNICCASFDIGGSPPQVKFEAIDISNPASPRLLGQLTGTGGYDITLSDTLAFVSGWIQGFGFEFAVVSIAETTAPRLLGTCATPGDNYGVWANVDRHRAYVADWDRGLQCIDITTLGSPSIDTTVLVADAALDVAVAGTCAYVANKTAALRILDLTDPAHPVEISHVDSAYANCRAVAAHDSFVYAGWFPSPYYLRSIDVADPAHPTMAGACSGLNEPEAMVLRDSLLYIAARLRFWVINVARPREPVLVGSCVIGENSWDLDVEGSVAAVANILNLQFLDVSDPASPHVIGNWPGGASGVDIVDTIAYVTAPYTGLVSLSIANPAAPYVLDSLYLEHWWNDVVVADSVAYVGGTWLLAVDVSNPRDLRVMDTLTPPNLIRRLAYDWPHVYAACYEAGVLVLDTVTVGIAEERHGNRPACTIAPTVGTGRFMLDLPETAGGWNVAVLDAAGAVRHTTEQDGSGLEPATDIDISGLPDGVYLIRASSRTAVWSGKVVKTRRR